MFPTDEEYEEFISELRKYTWKLSLSSGNCGIYAYALKKVFETGELFCIDGFTHVLLKYKEKFYDGEHLYYSFEELKDSRWGEYIDDEDENIEILDESDALERIIDRTANNRRVDEFERLIIAGLIEKDLESCLNKVI